MKKSFSRSRRRLAAFGSAIMLCLSLMAPLSENAAYHAQAANLPTEAGTEENDPAAEAGADVHALLESAVYYAEQYVSNTKIYTKDSIRNLETVLAAAKKTSGKKNVTEEELKEAYLALEHAMACMKFIPGETEYPVVMRELSPEAITGEMGTGITLEDALWVTGSEDLPVSDYLDRLKTLGFRSVRVPVDVSFWAVGTYPGSSVDEAPFSDLISIVDAAVSKDLYVILTPVLSEEARDLMSHVSEDPTEVDQTKAAYAEIWKKLADLFRDHDEHVIFEAMNAPYGKVFSGNEVRPEQSLICDLDQIFVNTVRSSGGNNQRRYLAVTGLRSNISWTVKEEYGFTLPEDPSERLMVSVQYTPRDFGLDALSDRSSFSAEDAEDLQKILEQLKVFTDQKIPVLLSDYRCVDKENASDRAYYLELVNVLCRDLGVVPVYGNPDEKTEGSASLIRRKDGTILSSECVNAIMRGMDPGCDPSASDVKKAPEQKDLEGIVITADPDRSKFYPSGSASLRSDSDGTGLYLKQGECFPLKAVVTPSGSTDPVIFTSSNEAVFTVSGGVVRARSLGDAVLYVSSQSGSAKSELPVHVSAADLKTPLKGITLSGDENMKELVLLPGESTLPDLKKNPEDSDAALEFSSTDSSVAYVSPQGRIHAVRAGHTVIVISASNGMVRYIPVTVCEPGEEQSLSLRLKLTLQGPGEEETVSDAETAGEGETAVETGEAGEGDTDENETTGEGETAREAESDTEREPVGEERIDTEKESVSEEVTSEGGTSGKESTSKEEENTSDEASSQKLELFSEPVLIRGTGVYRVVWDLEGEEERIAESLGDRSLWKFVSLSLAEDTENGKKPARLKEYDLDAEFDRIEFSPDVTEGMGVPSGYGWKDAGDPDHVQVGFDEQSLLSSDSYPDVYAGSELDFRYHVIPKRMELVIAVHKLAFDLEGIDRGPEGPDLKSASPTSFSMVTGESTDIAVKLQEEGKELSEEEFVLFLSSDRSIAWVDPIPVKRGNDGRVYASVTAKDPGTTTIKAISRDLKVVTFTVKVTKEPEIVETGKEPEETTMAPEKPTSEQPSVQDPSGSNALEVIMLGVLLGVIVLFMVIGTLILLKSARNK